MYPNRTWQQHNVNIGQYFDWVHGGTPGADLYISTGTFYDMPISRKHTPNSSGVYTTGGPWLSYQRFVKHGGDKDPIYRKNWGKAYSGQTYMNLDTTYNMLSRVQLDLLHKDTYEKGAEAWAAMRPAQPEFSAAVSLYELRELPRLYKTRLYNLLKEIKDEKKRIRRARRRIKKRRGKNDGRTITGAAGDMHLAVQFGWLPLISDIQSFAQEFNQKHKSLDQLIKDEGKPVKRRRKISSPEPAEDVYQDWYSTSWNPHVSPSFVTQCYAPSKWYKAYLDTVISTKVDTWAVGVFRYLLPPGPRTAGWKKRMYKRIMGSRITPAVVYQIMPWSWLADYFTDLGSFIEATSSGVEESLVADYAYVMRTVTITHKYDCRESVYSTVEGAVNNKSTTLELKDVVKMRVRASPFGFGLKESDLTLKQVGILGALGFSKMPNQGRF